MILEPNLQFRFRTGNPWLADSTAMVNHYYVYAVDDDFGPFFPGMSLISRETSGYTRPGSS